MKAHKFLQILAICLVLLVIVGIEACPQGGGGAAKTTGYVGLSASFIEGTPPVNVLVNQNFQIYAEVKNLGDANVAPGTASFYLSGLSPNVENIKSSLTNKNFLGKGSYERLDFADSAKSSLELIQPLNLVMLLTSCYKYGGRAQAEVCITSSNKSQVCSISGEKITFNTDEPVQVTSLKETNVGNKVQMSFTIENKGKGTVYLPDTDCEKRQKNDINEALKSDRLQVRISTIEKGLTCKLQTLDTSHNSIDALEGGASLGTVLCEKSLAGEEDHKTAIQIILDYVYIETSSRSMMISPA
jgi:hypothetical protein